MGLAHTRRLRFGGASREQVITSVLKHSTGWQQLSLAEGARVAGLEPRTDVGDNPLLTNTKIGWIRHMPTGASRLVSETDHHVVVIGGLAPDRGECSDGPNRPQAGVKRRACD